MKKYNKLLSFVLILALSLSCVPAHAAQFSNATDALVELELEQGQFANAADVEIQLAVDTYFGYRQDSYSSEKSFLSNGISVAKSAPLTQSEERNNALRDFWAEENVDIVSIESESTIRSAARNITTKDVALDVYEWTWVYYNNGDGPNAPATDYMGFATEHYITAQLQSDGSYLVVEDLYDEADISGYTSPGYISAEPPVQLSEINIPPVATVANTTSHSRLNRNGMPYVWNAIVYADQWVKKDIATNFIAQESYYNPTYGKAGTDSDCANYVNQCLSNSGFVHDPTSTSDRVASSDKQFWHNKNGSTTSSNSSYVWRTVTGIIEYWGDRYSYEGINLDKSNVFPGNPVITSNEGHVAICVGYNSAGVPIINGHTRDVFHQVLSGYAKTIKINTTNRLGTTPAQATTIGTFPKTYTQYLGSEACKWYKFTVPAGGGSYRFTTTGSSTVQGTLYKEKETSSYDSKGMAMYPLTQVNGSNNFTLNSGTLEAGTYFLLVKHVASSSTGSYTLTANKLS